ARVTYMNFLDIENAVINGDVDAGVLIHESILTYSSLLEVEREIWDIWVELCDGEELPLPLGGMCLRRSIPLNDAIKYENALIKAVDVANKNRKTLAVMLLEKGLIRVDAPTLDKYLDLYANDNSVKLSKIQYKAIDKLFELGYKSGHYQNLLRSQDFTIPSEYEDLRNS
ncbi:MAG TPA: succinate--CoA ligase, partial [Arcobacter skirrowii]|nr:succinate--CoA ligase [Aliarcobacter skirrowii]